MPKRRKRKPNRLATRRVRTSPLGDVETQPPADDELLSVAVPALTALSLTRHRLQAEHVVTSIFRGLSRSSEADDAARLREVTTLVSELVELCARWESPAALGLVRLLADQGPVACRAMAVTVADGLAARGVSEPRWLASNPLRVLRTWQTGIPGRPPSGVGLLFAYGSREHAVCVLIDDGAVRLILVLEGHDARLMRELQGAGRLFDGGEVVGDISELEALAVLRRALAAPPCPADGEVEAVAANLYLLHARVGALAEMLGEPPVELWVPDGEPAADSEILQITVTLADSEPPIWRRLEVPAGITLAGFQQILQIAFDRLGFHPYAFHRLTPDGREAYEGARLRRTKLSSVMSAAGDRLTYVSDGRHLVVLDARRSATAGIHYPRCTDGRRAVKPEHVGGAGGHEPDGWADEFAPDDFSRGAVNADLWTGDLRRALEQAAELGAALRVSLGSS